jgi:CheY-like chemotaxis protein/HPt (histidine-containing phosphotransfer) domain-containing protein
LGLLSQLGYRTDIATNGREALQALRHTPYDIILMDCHMPELDGYEAARKIRAANIPVHIIALTASAMHGDREKCLAAGMNDYLTKPLRVDALKAALERWSAPQKESVSRSETSAAEVEAIAPAVGDEEIAELLRESGGAEIGELAAMFEEEGPRIFNVIGQALENRDPDALRRAAHELKGACANFGAHRLEALCKTVEGHAHAGEIEAASLLVPAVVQEHERVIAALRARSHGSALAMSV